MNPIYNNHFINLKPKLTIEDLLEIEYLHIFTFPTAFKLHYLAFNGGEPEKYIFIDEDNDVYVIQQFIPITGEGRNLKSVLNHLRIEEIIPAWLIPFADEPSGDLYCFSIEKDSMGEIYLWYHEVEDPEESYSYLCNSLPNFINGMQEDLS